MGSSLKHETRRIRHTDQGFGRVAIAWDWAHFHIGIIQPNAPVTKTGALPSLRSSSLVTSAFTSNRVLRWGRRVVGDNPPLEKGNQLSRLFYNGLARNSSAFFALRALACASADPTYPHGTIFADNLFRTFARRASVMYALNIAFCIVLR